MKLGVVDFYASWCKPCMEAIPQWRELRAKYRDQGLRVVMVHTQDPEKQCGEGVSDFADDVICAHGATCGELDENHLFYLISRGIPRKEAKAMLRAGRARSSD